MSFRKAKCCAHCNRKGMGYCKDLVYCYFHSLDMRKTHVCNDYEEIEE
jgi:hypothetical protein